MEVLQAEVGVDLRPVIPCGIAVGRHSQFECEVRREFSAPANFIFETCALESWGWSIDRMHLSRIAGGQYRTTWQVERA